MRSFLKSNSHISGGAFLTAALLVLLLPLRWLLAALLAAAFHEACHYIAVRLCGGRPGPFLIGSRGAALQVDEMGRGRELICALAGPVGGLLLVALCRYIPRIAVCALIQSLYNLLPLYPMDGGRALSCAAALTLSPKWAVRVVQIARMGCLLLLFAGGIYGWLCLRLGIFALLPWSVVVFRKNSLQYARKTSTIEELTV